MESAFVYIEMDIPLFKIGSVGFPDFRFWVQRFNGPPRSIAYTLAVAVHINQRGMAPISRLTDLSPTTYHQIRELLSLLAGG